MNIAKVPPDVSSVSSPRFPAIRWLLASAVTLCMLGGVARAEIIPPGCKFNGVYLYLGVDKQVAHVGDTLKYSLIVGNSDFPACRAQDMTANITTPDGVVHPIALNRTILNPGESDSYDSIVSYVVRQQDIRPGGIVVGGATSTAVINQNIVNENATSFKEVNTIVLEPAIAIESVCQGGTGEFGPITFSGKVKNTGNIKLKGVTVVNTSNGETVLGPIELPAQQEATFQGSFVPTTACQGSASLTASGTDILDVEAPLFTPKTVTASTGVTCANTTNPQIKVVKQCPEGTTTAGAPLTYTATVQNLGDVTLTNIVVVSDRPAANTTVFTKASLAPGEVASFSASYPTPADACSVTDTLTATGRDRCTGLPVSNASTSTCPLSSTGSVKLVVSCPPSPAAAGGTITYRGTVSNPGSVTLTDVVVVNDALSETPVLRVASLAPGASANFTATAQVPVNTCSATAAFTATAGNRCGEGAVSDHASVSCPVNNAPAILVTHDCPANPLVPGESVSFSGTVSNTGNVTLKGVVVVQGEATLFGPADLAPGQSAQYTGSVTAPADTCAVSTTVTASGMDACSEKSVSNSSTKTCPVKTSPGLVLTKSCPESVPAAGASLTYSGMVKNTGNVTLTEVTVSREGRRFFGPITLAPGATTNVTQTITAPSGVCSITDTWTASGKDKCSGAVVTQEASTTCPVQSSAAVSLTVACPSGQLTPGGTARLAGTVRNTGNIALSNIVIVDAANPEVPVFTKESLAPGVSAAYTVTVTVPNNVCSHTVNLRVTAGDQCSSAGVSNTAAATCVVASSPKIAVEQSCPSEPGTPGLPSVFTGRVSNTGNITLTNVVVTRTILGSSAVVFGPVSLAPGQAADFTGSQVIPPQVTGCSYTSTIKAEGRNACNGVAVNAQNTISCTVDLLPGIEVQFNCPTSPVAPGRTATYTAVVRNIGNVQLNNVRVVNSLTGDRLVFSRSSLAVGQSIPFSGTYTVPNDCCSVTSTLKATAVDLCGNKPVLDTSTGTCPVLYTPKIAITKECPACTTCLEPGDTMTFTGKISNGGNIALEDVVVSHQVGESAVKILGPIVLAAGQTVNYKASFVIPVDYCGDVVTVTGKAACVEGTPVSASADKKCTVVTTPMIVVEKTCPSAPVAVGEDFTFSGTVYNVGNVTLTNVVVVNSQPTNGTVVLGPITLAPGASKTFTASYPLAANCCETLDVLTARGYDRCTGKMVENTAAAICPVRWSPLIHIVKNCTEGDSFWGSVQNLGNITLTNVVVVAYEAEGSPVTLLGPIELAPNEYATFVGTASPDTLVSASAVSLCHAQKVIAYAGCAGPIEGRDFRVTPVGASLNNFTLTWESLPGQRYRVEYKDSMTAPTWQRLGEDVDAKGLVTQKVDGQPSNQARLYRVLLLE